ncbi:hypothetical protein KPE71_13820 [Acinetobacter soli]|uniref:hypothetical protein n=1 Tax=Acinetobacter soli TaxID=487316 RepID=UPI001C0E5281|nr:hypothetical protein [Acinetobacter soli]MBU3121331.1 hypothetical protein [Acinetobacter soli]
MKIKTVHVDLSGQRNFKNAILVENQHVDMLREIECLDSEHIADALQYHFDEQPIEQNLEKEYEKTVSVFVNRQFYLDFNVHAEIQIVHSAYPIAPTEEDMK